jgi:ethanolamine utilization protein EutM
MTSLGFIAVPFLSVAAVVADAAAKAARVSILGFEATDAMLKSADVTLVGKEKIGAAYVTVIVKGDVAAVTAAVDAGAKAIGQLGKLIAAYVIARPHDDLAALLPK